MNVSIAIVFIFGLSPVTQTNPFIRVNDVITAVTLVSKKSCVDRNMEHILSSNPQIMQVKKQVEKIEGFNGKVFTFPGEPIFYVLFKQTPPFYPTIYEATPLYAQKMLIQYIENNDINIILYNTKTNSIQDEVPDKIRGRLLDEYIQANFSYYEKVGDYLILKR
jgi:hypothetical protein